MNIKQMMEDTVFESDVLRHITHGNQKQILSVPHICEIDNTSSFPFYEYYISGRTSLVLSVIYEYMEEFNIQSMDYRLSYETPYIVDKLSIYLQGYDIVS